MRGSDGRLHPEADWAKVAYLHAVVAVYGPWTESQTISKQERKRAQARVYEARVQLGQIENPSHDRPSPDRAAS